MKQVEESYKAFLAECHAKNLQRHLCDVEPVTAAKIRVKGQLFVNFASNDYLGLAHHPAVIEASSQYAKDYGAGSSASRLVTGNSHQFTEIEEKLAALKGAEAALIMASGYQANGAVLEALFDKRILKAAPHVVADRLNHASMHFGCKAAGVRQFRYHHLDAAQCREKLEQAEPGAPKFILTETVFSMDGDVAPIKDLVGMASAYDACLIADDAHGFGVLGKGGRGLAEGADITIGTFSKAMGSFGAYVAGSRGVIDYLIQRCGGLIYSTALPPATLGAISAAIDLLPGLDEARAKVASHAARFRQEMQALGLGTGKSETQIVPLIVGKAEAALALSNSLRDKGFWVTAIRPPTVPEGTSRLRVAFSAAHSDDEVADLIAVIKSAREHIDLEQTEAG
ncbi:MAG: putative 8-amino-7-oxononanoate synthase [Rhodomicrobium sp.]|nr:MAG: putative 8-amino-7-oxononanoate synthase [Rhodomicrobium sp.]